ncbi:MAG: Bor/Iss family lipoprotein [Longimicrobiales bacterium]
MKYLRTLGGVLTVVVVAGCYQATINTGRQASGQTIERPWAHSFLAGLVPPSVTETASTCPDGVARVVTQHSFLNVVAQIVTGSIYSPMTITVECAASVPEEAAADGNVVRASRGQEDQAMLQAMRRSLEMRVPVYIELE